MMKPLPLRWNALSSTGSSTGSSSFSTLARRRGRPKPMQSSRYCRKALSLKPVSLQSFSASMFLTHDRPCPWGSIMMGKREADVVRMPFCVDRSSVGSPWRFHWPLVASSTSMALTLRFLVTGIFLLTRSLRNHWERSMSLNDLLKGPVYDMKPHAMAQSPARRAIWSAKSALCCVQRSLSPASPLMSCDAASILRLVASVSSCRRCFSAMAASNLACMASSSAWAALSSASAPASFFMATASSASLRRRASILGMTTLAIMW
mmetsp:Transcript_24278/g.61120  ORF Transcript_24278/g.61120 Transcript_24278/m.61120 type:complete len:263 (-) Transcript_24278:3203-3991(-)